MDNELDLLEKQIAELQGKYKVLLDNKRADALQATRQAVRQYGFTASELGLSGSGATKKTSSPKEPKYANPANPEQTWVGGGASPKWVKAHIETGGTLEQLLIKR